MPAPTEPPRHLHALEAPPPDDEHDDQVPEDRAAEQAVLGAMLHTARARNTALDILTGPDFRLPAHEAIWDAITYLHFNGDPVDQLTVADHLDPKTLRRIGGAAYLGDLYGDVITAENVDHHAHIVAKAATRRRLDAAGTAIRQLATTPGDLDQILDRAGTELAKATSSRPATTGPHPWEPVDLGPVLAGTHATPTATLMTRRDGKALIYPAAVHSIAGEPGGGKTWAALVAVTQELAAGHPALYIDHEDRPTSIVNRLLSLGATPDQITRHLRYIRPENALDTAGWTHVAKAADGCRLAVIDGITEAMVLHGLETNSNDDAAAWLALLPNRLAGLGLGVVQIDHVTKNSETRGRYALGAQHKLAGITGVAYKIVTIKAMAKGAKGHAKLIIDKDKHGDVGPVGITVADLHLDATDDTGIIRAWLDTPGADHDDEGRFRPTVLMSRVSEFLTSHPGASTNGIVAGVRGKRAALLEALACLIREGYVRTEEAPRGGLWHYSDTPFDGGDE